MSVTVCFDTNYIRSFSQNDFLSGNVPQKLIEQIEKISARGDSIAVLETVRLEVNAWLMKASISREAEIQQSIVTLEAAGYKLDKTEVLARPDRDFFEMMKAVDVNCFLMLPEIDEYREAERRTSFRLPPHPKNIEGEEMRDRLIWCQLLNFARKTKRKVILVSGDTIFKNGAATDEAKEFGIECLGDAEFEQRIGLKAPHIIEIIEIMESFGAGLGEHGVALNSSTVESLQDLRKRSEPDGTLSMKFNVISHNSGLPEKCAVTLSVLDDEAYFIQINTEPLISLYKPLSNNGQEIARHSAVSQRLDDLGELRNILRG